MSGFGLGTPTSVLLDPSAFRIRADSNAAKDADDRFIFRNSDDTLWFDRDGTGSAYSAKLVADLQPGATLSADDFWLVA